MAESTAEVSFFIESPIELIIVESLLLSE
jgi:hypothetical protein